MTECKKFKIDLSDVRKQNLCTSSCIRKETVCCHYESDNYRLAEHLKKMQKSDHFQKQEEKKP